MQNLIIWAKGGSGLGDLEKSLATDFELLLAWNRGAEIVGKRIGSVWTIPKDNPESYAHPTQKPVLLAAQAIQCFCPPGKRVLDPFSGSGTVLSAAEQTGRLCSAVELEPRYVALTLERAAGLGLAPVTITG